MGEKGSTTPDGARHTAEALVESLAPLGQVFAKVMFGGFGIFADGVMFALVDSAGTAFLKIPPGGDDYYKVRHHRMPYGEIPESVLADDSALRLWARQSIDAAGAAKG